MKITINKTFDIDSKTLEFMQRLYEEEGVEDLPDNISDKEQEIFRKYVGEYFDEVWNKLVLTFLGKLIVETYL